MKNSRRFTQFTQISRVLRFGSGVALISAAAAMALVAVKPSNPSLATSQELQWTEDGKMSAAFAKHREDLFAAKVGAAGESPALVDAISMQVELNNRGQIDDFKVIAGARSPGVDQWLQELVLLSQFKPATHWGLPVRSRIILSFVTVRG